MQIGVTELEVQGKVPEWLEGDFYRTGPGLLAGYTHWFDGMAMLVNFRFSGGGKVLWQQRFLDSADYRMYREAGNKPQLQAFKYTPGVFKASMDAIKDLLGLGIGAAPLMHCLRF
jgi:carotenoid cleavage dioxygenase-like enzyme